MRHSKKLGLSESNVRRILHLDLHFHPYKIKVVQKLKEDDAAKRSVFSQQMLALINRNKEVLNNLIMSDEAHFHLTGLVNKQNCRYCLIDTHGNSYKNHCTVLKYRCGVLLQPSPLSVLTSLRTNVEMLAL